MSEPELKEQNDPDEGAAAGGLWPTIGRLAAAMKPKKGALDAGMVASLRRLDPASGVSPAFYQVAAYWLETELPHVDDPQRADAERKWAAILRTMALLAGLHVGQRHLGHALADAGYSDLRFERLLRAQDEILWDEIRRAAHYLVSKGQGCDQGHIARLILSDGRSDAECVRRDLARRYYGELRRK